MSYPNDPDVSSQLARPTTVHLVPSYFISESPCPATFENPRPTLMPLIVRGPAASSGGTLSLASHAPSRLVTTVGLLNVTWCDQLQAVPVVGSAQPAGARAVRLTSYRTTQTSSPRPRRR
jgi:hypothetical protein